MGVVIDKSMRSFGLLTSFSFLLLAVLLSNGYAEDSGDSTSASPTTSSVPTTSGAPTPSTSSVPTPNPTITAEPTTSGAPSDGPTTVPTISSHPTISSEPSSTPTEEPECYTSLTLLESKMENQDPFVENTYILCPNTVFPVGFPGAGGACCENGQSAIYARKNTVIKCGEDGSHNNNCTITGGQYQMLALEPCYFEDIENFVVQGVNFNDAFGVMSIMSIPGDMMFKDCSFTNHRNLGAINLIWRPFFDFGRRSLYESLSGLDPKQRRDLVAADYMAHIEGKDHSGSIPLPKRSEEKSNDLSLNNNRRRLDDAEKEGAPFEHMELTFRNCTFENNGMLPFTIPGAEPGLIVGLTEWVDIVIENCVFTNNDFGSGPKGFAVSARDGANLFISDSCFYNNNFTGNGVVEVMGGPSYTQVQEIDMINNGGYNNDLDADDVDDLECLFVGDARENDTTICIPFDESKSIECGYPAPSAPPSAGVKQKVIGSFAAGCLLLLSFSVFT